jgi:hypothetical protein
MAANERMLADCEKEDVRTMARLLFRAADDALGWVRTL